jgi:RNA-binding protein YhbY
MKSLHEYIASRNQPYEFRIKVAKQNPNDIMEEIKNALDAYELVSVTKAKSLPVM